MARESFSAPVRACKSGVSAASLFSPALSHDLKPAPAADPDRQDSDRRIPDRRFASATAALRIPGVTPEEHLAILAALEETGGVREIGDLAEAVPGCQRPISAVLALVDAGLLAIDLAAPFDAATRVARIA